MGAAQSEEDIVIFSEGVISLKVYPVRQLMGAVSIRCLYNISEGIILVGLEIAI